MSILQPKLPPRSQRQQNDCTIIEGQIYEQPAVWSDPKWTRQALLGTGEWGLEGSRNGKGEGEAVSDNTTNTTSCLIYNSFYSECSFTNNMQATAQFTHLKCLITVEEQSRNIVAKFVDDERNRLETMKKLPPIVGCKMIFRSSVL